MTEWGKGMSILIKALKIWKISSPSNSLQPKRSYLKMKVDLIGNLLAIKPPLAITSETILIFFNCLIFFSKASEGICNKNSNQISKSLCCCYS